LHKIKEGQIMHWHDIEEIAENLEDNYSDYYNPTMTLSDLEKMIRDLKDFEDHDKKVKEVTLEEILDKWAEIREDIQENN